MDIYLVKITSLADGELSNLYPLMDSEKSKRVQRFIKSEDKLRTTVGEVLIRYLIMGKIGIENKEIYFEKNLYGKPSLKGFPSFHFNISHSGNYVMCAINDNDVGCDIEEIKPLNVEEISTAFFTNEECKYINSDSNNRLDKFYEIWTLKESYIKCCGLGLSLSLKDFSINISLEGNISVVNGNYQNDYYKSLFQYNVIPGYKIAVCSGKDIVKPNIITVDQKELISHFNNIYLQQEKG
ncbi:4'-phosphopantetheinyl transferase [Gracilibacillus orientalis]|uniref:4'-phosphopantetheinyl transferase n=1 Tax=Gracilibacillus orientalis TaxID=334253 RepID=A0A1I4H5W5_9BACI|nr:4'-phosphopantetheinyl transferase superfamily protein [Gracilibacillus orientalis]SFL37565.1 4'-phosphopantetheinyl transferase [Gracilibacillus orientalis]